MVEKQNVNQFKLELGSVVTGKFYEFQELRKSTMSRIRNIVFRKYTGLELNELQDKKQKTDEEKLLVKEFTDDQLQPKLKELLSNGKITEDEHSYIMKMFDLLDDIREKEKQYKKLVQDFVMDEPIYNEFIYYVKGVDILSTAMLLYYFGYCEKARYPSSLEKYSGITPDSQLKKGESAGYNPKCKTFLWRVSDAIIKQNFNKDKAGNRIPERYRKRYDTEKERQIRLLDKSMKALTKEVKKNLKKADEKEQKKLQKLVDDISAEFSKDISEKYFNKGTKINQLIDKAEILGVNVGKAVDPHAPKNRTHADLRARRKIIKGLLIDYYRVAKTLTGQEQSTPYAIEKLGHEHFDDVLDWIEQKKKEVARKEHGVA